MPLFGSFRINSVVGQLQLMGLRDFVHKMLFVVSWAFLLDIYRSYFDNEFVQHNANGSEPFHLLIIIKKKGDYIKVHT